MRGTDGFIKAAHYTGGRPAGITQFVWHSAETGEGGGVARNIAGWFANPDSGGSTNVSVDSSQVWGSVEWDDTPWSCRVSEVDRRAGSAELAGRASQSTGEWLDGFGLALLDRAARMFAETMYPRVAVRWLTHDQIRQGVSGMMGHGDVTYAYGVAGGHTDPGAGFPWGWLEDRIRAYTGGGTPGSTPEPPPDSPGTAHPTLHYGMVGEAVKEWQRRFGSLIVDGVFGPKTMQSTKEFQAWLSLVVDGIVGPITWAASDYLHALPDQPAPPLPIVDFSGYATIRFGSRSSVVVQWQSLLNSHANGQLAADGAFGPRTDEATKNFQRFWGLVVDGIVGPRTWEMMAYAVAL